MKLPNAESAVVDARKIIDYLLNASHPENGGKAAFFVMNGFSSGDWQALADALRNVAISAEISDMQPTIHGIKYIVDGSLKTAVGKVVPVRTVWIIDAGAATPRLVTAYPTDA